MVSRTIVKLYKFLGVKCRTIIVVKLSPRLLELSGLVPIFPHGVLFIREIPAKIFSDPFIQEIPVKFILVRFPL